MLGVRSSDDGMEGGRGGGGEKGKGLFCEDFTACNEGVDSNLDWARGTESLPILGKVLVTTSPRHGLWQIWRSPSAPRTSTPSAACFGDSVRERRRRRSNSQLMEDDP